MGTFTYYIFNSKYIKEEVGKGRKKVLILIIVITHTCKMKTLETCMTGYIIQSSIKKTINIYNVNFKTKYLLMILH